MAESDSSIEIKVVLDSSNLEKELEGLKTVLTSLGVDVTELSNAMKEYHEAQKEAANATQELNKTIKENQSANKASAESVKKNADATQKAEKAQSKLKKTFDSLKATVEKYKNAIDGLAHTLQIGSIVSGTVVNAFNKVAAAVNECTEAYKVQAAAETQLETAAKNNPYLNGQSVSALKAFASEIQGYSTFGDEALLPLMAQLAAAGRTQSEIQDIMKASADIAAGGMMSIESAVDALNKSYNGMAGMLGKQNAAIAALTEEELKSGKAVEIMAKQYSGMAKSVADATGSSTQLSNSIGDLKEVIGKDWEEWLAPFRKSMQSIVDELIAAKVEADNTKKALDFANGTSSNKIKLGIDIDKDKIRGQILQAEKDIEKSNEGLEKATKDGNQKVIDYLTAEISKKRDEIKELQKQLGELDLRDALKEDINAMSEETIQLNIDAIVKRVYTDEKKNKEDFNTASAGGLTGAGSYKEYEAEQLKRLEMLFARQDELRKNAAEVPAAPDKPKGKAAAKDKPPELDAYEKAKKIFEDTKKNYENELNARKDAGELISREVELQERLSMEASRYVSFQAECLRLQQDENAVFQKHKADYEDTNKAAQDLVKNLQAWEKASSDFGKGIEAGNETLEETEQYLEDIYKIELTATQKLKDAQSTLSNTLNDLIAKKVHGLEIDREQVAAYAEMKEAQFAAAMATLEASGYSKEQLEVIEKMVAAQQTLNKLKKQEAAAARAQNKQKSDAILDKTGTKGPKQKGWLGQAKEDLSVLKERKSGVKEEKELLLKEVYIPDENNQQRAAQSWADLMANKLKLSEETQAKINALEQEGTDIAEAQNATRLQAAQNAMSMIADISGQVASAMNGLCEMMIGQIEAEADAEREEVARQYNEGAISYEEYCDKKAAIERKAAREKYKVELAQWAIDLTMATVNGAQAVLSALTAGPIIGPIMAAVAGAAAAVQIATVAANKPKPPSFATGGVVGGFKGASMGGDNTTANVRNGEMILNAQQQKQLWGVANGAGAEGGNVSLNVNVVNNAANEVETKQTMDTDGLTVLINKIVAHNMSEGKFTESMDKAEARRDGERWL